ncbi:MAG: hypothetical protein KDI75_01245 [Xanthomonadales bacterium]|nr:hypothetical protein [Xanthomonadales bacterium]
MPTTRRQKLFALSLGLLPLPAAALDVVYEGFLEDDGAPANGIYELRVTPQYDAKRGPLQAEPIVFPAVEVSGGQFRLEFSVDDATADEVWLSLAVRGVDDPGEAIPLPGLTKAVAGVGGTCWSTAGNSGTDASMDFIGTIDAQPLVLRVHNTPSLRLVPDSILVDGLPATMNVVAGSSYNAIPANASATTIAGGGSESSPNRVFSDYSAISGGYGNSAGDELLPNSSAAASVGGGRSNIASGFASVVSGGYVNSAVGHRSTIAGGSGNKAIGEHSTVSGGNLNCAGGWYSWTGGRRAISRHGSSASIGCNGVGSVGTNGDEGTFVWADSQDSNFISSGSNQFLVRASGGAGFGTNAPENAMHVVGDINGIGAVGNHVMQIENASTASDADVLALRVNAAGTLTNAVNFITFFGSGPNSVGTIEGNGAGGVVLSGPGNDFAEYLPKADAAEQIQPGELLGLHAGRVSRRTDGADRLLVASSAPIVAGNDPGTEQREQFVLTALVGQAEVRVRGQVQRGDWLVASGNDDGVASAINGKNASNPETSLPFGQVVEILASADSDSTNDIRRVRVMLGDNGQQMATKLHELAVENRALREELVRLRDRQNGEIASLQAQLAEIRELMLPAVAERSH